jgi:ABC-type phosphate transport system auxiliary subunit
MRLALFLIPSIVLVAAPAAAQDIRGLEICTAEKAMDRRTSCLQSNVEFLHQALDKQRRDLQGKLDAAARDATAEKVEIAALKAALAKLQQELMELKRSKPDIKPENKPDKN